MYKSSYGSAENIDTAEIDFSVLWVMGLKLKTKCVGESPATAVGVPPSVPICVCLRERMTLTQKSGDCLVGPPQDMGSVLLSYIHSLESLEL